jgi:hypothetical protein
MLLVKPCIVLCTSPKEEEKQEIEFQNMMQEEGSDEGMNEGGNRD